MVVIIIVIMSNRFYHLVFYNSFSDRPEQGVGAKFCQFSVPGQCLERQTRKAHSNDTSFAKHLCMKEDKLLLRGQPSLKPGLSFKNALDHQDSVAHAAVGLHA